jgi:hypothetical protein
VNFPSMLVLLRQGKAFRRKAWEDQPQLNIMMDKDGLLISRKNGKPVNEASFDLDDVLAEDWEEYRVKYSFGEAMQAVLSGKAAYRESHPYYAVIYDEPSGKLYYTNQCTIRYKDEIAANTEEIKATDWLIVEPSEIRS